MSWTFRSSPKNNLNMVKTNLDDSNLDLNIESSLDFSTTDYVVKRDNKIYVVEIS